VTHKSLINFFHSKEIFVKSITHASRSLLLLHFRDVD